jgi:23S rRNA (cytidine1920-2'-O)/16S rRNA (cytidine1409-2'-O)-methyltransferase
MLTTSKKSRLDHLLVERNLAESRTKAKALILAGQVLVDEVPIDKVGTLIANEAKIRVKEKLKYVSRGGLKLEKALSEFKIIVQNKICLDIGASTGGFTDCLLQNGAKKVYAIDVGYGQLHWRLQKDKNVIVFDRENFRHFDLAKIKDKIEIIVTDVSFISLSKILPKVKELCEKQGKSLIWIALFKPQFEVGKEHVEKGGIVKNHAVRIQALEDFKKKLKENSFENIQSIESPITGADGNVEYLVLAKSHSQ